MVMTGLIMDIEFLFDVVYFFTIIGTNSVFDMPLADLAIDKQGGISITTTIEGGM
jgi:hypothetical protein